MEFKEENSEKEKKTVQESTTLYNYYEDSDTFSFTFLLSIPCI